MTIEMFQDGPRWRWRLRARRDNRELAVSSESFGHRVDCVDAIRALKLGVAAAPVLDASQSPPAVIAI